MSQPFTMWDDLQKRRSGDQASQIRSARWAAFAWQTATSTAWVAAALTAAGLLVLYSAPFLQDSDPAAVLSCRQQSSPVPPTPSVAAPSPPPILSVPVQKLLLKLKEARRIAESDGDWAAGNRSGSYSAAESAAWADENPCRARSELPPLYARRKVAEDIPKNPQWTAVFDEYTRLHRACTTRIGNVTDAYVSRRVIPGCKFVTGETHAGLGNKIIYAASLTMYAVLTQRVLLLPWDTAASTMCEPFEGSRWVLPPELERLNARLLQPNKANMKIVSNVTTRFLTHVDEAGGRVAAVEGKGGFFHAEADNGWQPVDRFFCDTEQEFLSKAQWFSAAGTVYFLPKLYAIPSFRPTLEAIFPDPSLTMTYVLRSAFLPADQSWDRIRRIYAMDLETADRRVGLQPRYRGGLAHQQRIGSRVNTHITKCLQENAILPTVASDEASSRVLMGRSPPFSIVKVLITSLFMDLHDHLSRIYLRHPTVTGESIGLVQLTHEQYQTMATETDRQALAEMILLSLSDELLVTPSSTFGGVAQVYGALKPWIIDFKDRDEGSCSRSPSVDLCYQMATSVLSCPFDTAANGSLVTEKVPFIVPCSPLEITYAGPGLLLHSSTLTPNETV